MFKKKSLLRSMAILMLLALALRFGSPAYAALSAVGPSDTSNGFPVWYQDSNGLALELCTDQNYCTLTAADLPNQSAPLSFPDNYPHEMFWWTGESAMNFTGLTGPGSALLIMAVEAAFSNELPIHGDQITFSRFRLKINGLVPGGVYTITYPYGVINLEADAFGEISYVNDFGIGIPGDPKGYAGLLGGVIGPFLVWDETQAVIDPNTGLPVMSPPPGFIGDIGIAHQVTGSPFNTNFFRIEGPGFSPNNVSTDLFTVTGKKFTGVIQTINNLQIERATYSWPTATGIPQAHIFAIAMDATSQLVVSSTAGAIMPLAAPIHMEQIVITGDPFAVPPIPDQPTNKFFVNVDLSFPGLLVPNISITDLSLNQALRATLTDRVTITEASFNQATSTLTVSASSSDAITLPVLVVVGFDPSNNVIGPTGTFTVVLDGPPNTVTVQSSSGGVDTAEVILSGTGSTSFAPAFSPPLADAGLPQTVFVNTRVQLSAAASTGVISDYTWVQIGFDADGHTVPIFNWNSSHMSFNFPTTVNTPIPLLFQITVTGPGGVSSATVQVNAEPVPVLQPVTPTIERAWAKDVAPGGKGEWRIDGTISPLVQGVTVDILIFDPTNPGVTQTLATGLAIDPVFGAFEFREKDVTLTLSANTLVAIAISDTGNPSAQFPLSLE